MGRGFETTRRSNTSEQETANYFARYRPQIIVSVLVVAALIGGAFYAARATEKAPKVVYSASLDEIEAEANQPLKINLNTANVDELDELPQVGPSTAQEIIDHRRANGMFRSVDELEEVSGIGPKTLEEIRPFAGV
ncbi:MAG: helix-hairpin-helix domain-containing protein [Rubrobacteraceae bacterium]